MSQTSINRRHQAQRAIRDMVLKGELLPGAPVVEQELADKLGLSRTPIREALAELAREGLIRTVGARAKMVAEPNLQDVVELFDLREMVEGLATRWLAARVTDEQLAELESIARPVDTGELGAEHDCHFHDLIVRWCGNGRVRHIVSNAHVQWVTFRFAELMVTAGAIKRRAPEEVQFTHMKIVAALASRDPEQSEAVAREHVREIRSRFLSPLS